MATRGAGNIRRIKSNLFQREDDDFWSQPVVAVEVFERKLRRSAGANNTQDYLSHPLVYPVGEIFDYAIFQLNLRVTALGGSTPSLEILVEDGSDGEEWALIDLFSHPSLTDGIIREEITAPFGAYLRITLRIDGGVAPALMLCQGSLTLRRKPVSTSTLWSDSPTLAVTAAWRQNSQRDRHVAPPSTRSKPQTNRMESASNAPCCGTRMTQAEGQESGGARGIGTEPSTSTEPTPGSGCGCG